MREREKVEEEWSLILEIKIAVQMWMMKISELWPRFLVVMSPRGVSGGGKSENTERKGRGGLGRKEGIWIVE